MGCGSALGPFGQALVCQYTKKGCDGEGCNGNVAGAFQANVKPNATDAGPCDARQWPAIVEAAKAAFVVQKEVPSLIEALRPLALSPTSRLLLPPPLSQQRRQL